jgi:CBS domain-containing protein
MGTQTSQPTKPPVAPTDLSDQPGNIAFPGSQPMQTVADILRSKSDPKVYTIAPQAMVYDAIEMMNDRHIGALVVLEGDEIVGIVTERDFTQKMVLKARLSRATPVGDIMTSPVILVRSEQTTEDCMVLMGANKVRHLPVVDGGRLVGMVSIRDLVNDIIANL